MDMSISDSPGSKSLLVPNPPNSLVARPRCQVPDAIASRIRRVCVAPGDNAPASRVRTWCALDAFPAPPLPCHSNSSLPVRPAWTSVRLHFRLPDLFGVTHGRAMGNPRMMPRTCAPVVSALRSLDRAASRPCAYDVDLSSERDGYRRVWRCLDRLAGKSATPLFVASHAYAISWRSRHFRRITIPLPLTSIFHRSLHRTRIWHAPPYHSSSPSSVPSAASSFRVHTGLLFCSGCRPYLGRASARTCMWWK